MGGVWGGVWVRRRKGVGVGRVVGWVRKVRLMGRKIEIGREERDWVREVWG